MESIDSIMECFKFIASLLLVFGITFEVTPIKISPLKWLGRHLNKETNDRIDKIQKQVDGIQYNEDMKDLRNVKARIHNCGRLIQKGETLPEDMLKGAIDDLDVYDFYKEKYGYMYINGIKVKINGETKVDRKLIEDQLYIIKKENN